MTGHCSQGRNIKTSWRTNYSNYWIIGAYIKPKKSLTTKHKSGEIILTCLFPNKGDNTSSFTRNGLFVVGYRLLQNYAFGVTRVKFVFFTNSAKNINFSDSRNIGLKICQHRLKHILTQILSGTVGSFSKIQFSKFKCKFRNFSCSRYKLFNFLLETWSGAIYKRGVTEYV